MSRIEILASKDRAFEEKHGHLKNEYGFVSVYGVPSWHFSRTFEKVGIDPTLIEAEEAWDPKINQWLRRYGARQRKGDPIVWTDLLFQPGDPFDHVMAQLQLLVGGTYNGPNRR